MKKVTINAIAEKANVSKSTVSRAINGNGYVQQDIKDYIISVAQDMGYSKLKKNKRITVAVVFPSFSDVFFGSIIEGISKFAEEKDCCILLYSTHHSTKKEEEILTKLCDMDISGLIFTPVAAYDGIEGWNRIQNEMDNLHIPIVLVDRSDKRANCDSIIYDNYNGAYLLGERLINEGYTDIGAIIGDTNLQLGHNRLEGFKNALRVHNLKITEDFFLTDERIISSEKAYIFTEEKIKERKLPKAVFISNTLIGEGFFKALFANKIEPGKDVRIVGFDYMDFLNVISIPYTYLNRETGKTGQMAMQMILDHFNSKIVSKRDYIIPATIME